MLLNIDPTITGTFVHKIMDDEDVAQYLASVTKDEAFKHNMVKAIMIATTRDLEYDSNKAIKKAVSKSFTD